MATSIDSLLSVDGVRGVAMLDTEGSCVAHRLPAPYDPSLMGVVVSTLEGALEAFASLVESDAASSLLVRFDGGLLMMRRLGPYRLVALLSAETNLAMFNVALNVVALHAARASSPSLGHASSDSVTGLSASRTGGESQRLSSSDGVHDEVIPPDAVGRAAVHQLLGVCSNYLGPASKLVIKQQLAALGVSSRTLRRGQWGDLVASLAQKIPTAPARAAFSKQAMALVSVS